MYPPKIKTATTATVATALPADLQAHPRYREIVVLLICLIQWRY